MEHGEIFSGQRDNMERSREDIQSFSMGKMGPQHKAQQIGVVLSSYLTLHQRGLCGVRQYTTKISNGPSHTDAAV